MAGVILVLIALVLDPRIAIGAEHLTVEWADPDAAHPWLAEVKMVGREGASVTPQPKPRGSGDYPNGMGLELAAPAGSDGSVQVQLKGGYGFVFSARMLAANRYLWMRDLGIFISRDGWAAETEARLETGRRVRESMTLPYVSAAEHYYNWSGLTEHEPDDVHRLIWEYLDAKEAWPVEARAGERIAAMPEVDAPYFDARFPDLKYSKMFLGWPDHDDQFTLWSHGKVTISSQSVGGSGKGADGAWLPRAPAYSFQFAAGDTALPRYREYGDEGVHQALENGHDLVVATDWNDGGVRIRQTNFAVPLGGDEVRTGVEPLVLWSRITLSNEGPAARETWLGIEFTDEDFRTFLGSLPLEGVGGIEWRDGAFFLGGKLIAMADPALAFEKLPAHGDVARFRARVSLSGSGARQFEFAHLYRLVDAGRLADLRRAGYERSRRRMLDYWDRFADGAATIRVPDELLNNLYRTFLPRIAICSHLDPDGMAVLHTSPIQYARVWHSVTAFGVGGDLAVRGRFDLARKYLEPFFTWQDIPAPDSPAIKDWDGFFGAPAVQCARVWISFQGTILWAAARYYELSGDRAWLDAKLPALIRAMEWIVRNRRSTRVLNADGSRPLDWGWMPPGRASDGDVGTTIANDACLWQGLDAVAGVLKSIGHPRAAEFQREAAEYRSCLQDGERRAAAERPLMRLNDGTWIPYLPAMLGTTGRERDARQIKYPMVVDLGWAAGMLDTHVFPAGSPEVRWLTEAWQDSYTPLLPNLPDEPFTLGIFDELLDRDRVAEFLYTFYSMSTTTMDRETLTTYEHRSWGRKRAFELAPWAAGYWTTAFAKMHCRTKGNELWLLQATPRRWLDDGKKIVVRELQTEFGPVSLRVESRLATGTVVADVTPPMRTPPRRLRLRLRAPDGHALVSVTVNGRRTAGFNSGSEWIELPPDAGRIHVEAGYVLASRPVHNRTQ